MRTARVFACSVLATAVIALAAVHGLNALPSHVGAGGRMDNGQNGGTYSVVRLYSRINERWN